MHKFCISCLLLTNMVMVPNYEVVSGRYDATRFWMNERMGLWIVVINFHLLLCIPNDQKRFSIFKIRTFHHGIKSRVHLCVRNIDENCDKSWGCLSWASHNATENEEYSAAGSGGLIMKGLSNFCISLLYPIEAVGVSSIDTSGSSKSYINLTLWSMTQSGGEEKCLRLNVFLGSGHSFFWWS
jgi:hypothetical protein